MIVEIPTAEQRLVAVAEAMLALATDPASAEVWHAFKARECWFDVAIAVARSASEDYIGMTKLHELQLALFVGYMVGRAYETHALGVERVRG